MTDSERDDLIEMLVTTLGEISGNVEKLAAEMRRIIEKQEQLEKPRQNTTKGLQ